MRLLSFKKKKKEENCPIVLYNKDRVCLIGFDNNYLQLNFPGVGMFRSVSDFEKRSIAWYLQREIMCVCVCVCVCVYGGFLNEELKAGTSFISTRMTLTIEWLCLLESSFEGGVTEIEHLEWTARRIRWNVIGNRRYPCRFTDENFTLFVVELVTKISICLSLSVLKINPLNAEFN